MHSARMLRSTGKNNTDCPILSCNVSIALAQSAGLTVISLVLVRYTSQHLPFGPHHTVGAASRKFYSTSGSYLSRDVLPPVTTSGSTQDSAAPVRGPPASPIRVDRGGHFYRSFS